MVTQFTGSLDNSDLLYHFPGELNCLKQHHVYRLLYSGISLLMEYRDDTLGGLSIVSI